MDNIVLPPRAHQSLGPLIGLNRQVVPVLQLSCEQMQMNFHLGQE